MTANKMPWFRLYSEILDDKKIKRICRATSFNKATVIGVWVCLLALANESSDRGALQISDGIPYDINDLAAETELPEDQLDTLLKMFERYDMLHFDSKEGWSILNWNGRQFKSDNVAIRVAQHRERKAQEEVKRYSNVIDSDSDTESDIDIDSESIKGGDLFDACMAVFEKKKGTPITDGQSFTLMINNFKANGVTADDYSAAIDAMDADPRYKGSKPTSYEKWAIGYAEKRRNPQKYSSDKKVRQDARKLDPATYRGWGK
jgi:hypothetical protein